MNCLFRGIKLGFPGFLKQKHRDRSSTATDTTEASAAWYTNDGKQNNNLSVFFFGGGGEGASLEIFSLPNVAFNTNKTDTKEIVPIVKTFHVVLFEVPLQ